MLTHLILGFGKDAAGTTIAIIFLVGFAAYGLAQLIASRKPV